ncbi:MAG: hypothetical protein EXR75_00690 [Myxococcales bacterium]|nr:hypothetical protein [Myxococcales bacterium]
MSSGLTPTRGDRRHVVIAFAQRVVPIRAAGLAVLVTLAVASPLAAKEPPAVAAKSPAVTGANTTAVAAKPQVAAVASAAAVAPKPPAVAEPGVETIVAARQMFIDGLALEASGDYQGALRKFEIVGQVKMVPSVRYHIALCNVQLGRLVDALNGFELAAQEARAAGEKFRDVAENAPVRAAALRMKVGKVRIVVRGTIRSSSIVVDGKKLAHALVGIAIPIDPGTHILEVVRDGKVIDKKQFVIDAGGRRELELTIDDPPDVVPAAATGSAASPSPAKSPSRAPAFASAGAGLALLVGAGVFWGLREGTIAVIRETCLGDDRQCDPDVQPTEDLGRAYTTASAALVGVGLAGLAGGGVLWFVLTPPDATKPASGVQVGIAPVAGGARLIGSF